MHQLHVWFTLELPIFIDHKNIHFLIEVDRNSFSGGKDSHKTEINSLKLNEMYLEKAF